MTAVMGDKRTGKADAKDQRRADLAAAFLRGRHPDVLHEDTRRSLLDATLPDPFQRRLRAGDWHGAVEALRDEAQKLRANAGADHSSRASALELLAAKLIYSIPIGLEAKDF